ncbi:hypothetical protein [Bradyrhizobium monzae]|uniref:hypothetical protein n=1 Tax=Bradyrhizobium sp. Oc8 TaxID=2876780 RepID=UPI001F1BFBED|nr:hypothetical protein [Bradyrhizobium sp. Oc8]
MSEKPKVARPSIDANPFLQRILRNKIAPPTIPCLNRVAAAEAFPHILATVLAGAWPSGLPLPDFLVVSTLARSPFYEHGVPGIVIHDEGAVDLYVATASILQHCIPYLPAPPLAYAYTSEQMIVNRRIDLGAMRCSICFSDGGPPHPMFAKGMLHARDPQLAAFFERDSDFSLNSSWAIGDIILEQELEQIVRLILICHELGHYLVAEGQTAKIVARLRLDDAIVANEEVLADIIAVTLAYATLYGAPGFTRKGAMSAILGLCFVIFEINDVFSHAQERIRDLCSNPVLNRGTHRTLPSDRFRVVRDALTDTVLARRMLRLAGSRASHIHPIIYAAAHPAREHGGLLSRLSNAHARLMLGT